MSEFLAMGGYAEFVWSAFALTFVVMTGMAIWIYRDHQRTLAMIRRRLAGDSK